MVRLMIVLFASLVVIPAQARWKAEYAAAPPEVQDWYARAELTEAAKKRFSFKLCCSHADVVKTRFSVNRTTNGDEWYFERSGQWVRIPDDIIHWGEHAPDGRPTLFALSDGRLTCFWPGEDGN